jgi:hypothetical protein
MIDLRTEWHSLREEGVDVWLRHRSNDPLSALTKIAVVGVLAMILGTFMPGVVGRALVILLGLLAYPIAVGYFGRAWSMRYDHEVSDFVRFALLLQRPPIPHHPAWWKEGKGLWRGYGFMLLRSSGVVSGTAWTVAVLAPRSSSVNTWGGGIALGAAAVWAVTLDRAHAQRRRQFVADVRGAVSHASYADVGVLRQTLEAELRQKQELLTDFDRMIEKRRQVGAEGVVLEEFRRFERTWRAVSEEQERRGRVWDLALAGLGVVLSVGLGFALGLLAKAKKWM